MVDSEAILETFHKYFRQESDDISIDDEGYISVDTCTSRERIKFKHLPVRFRSVREFMVDYCDLESLEGSPIHCDKFFCYANNLTSLVGCPQDASLIDCSNKHITSLIGMSSTVKELTAHFNPLSSLEGLGKDVKSITITYNPTLPLLRLVHIPEISIFYDGSTPDNVLEDIFQRHHKGKNTSRLDVLSCQRDLIKEGYEGNARW